MANKMWNAIFAGFVNGSYSYSSTSVDCSILSAGFYLIFFMIGARVKTDPDSTRNFPHPLNFFFG